MLSNSDERGNGFLLAAGLLIWLALVGGISANPNSETATGSRDYYVSVTGSDSNNGSVAKPWRTISHAAVSVSPGATVHVAPGQYVGSIVTLASGNPHARIRFISDRQWTAMILGKVGEAVWQNKGDFVDIAGFDLTGPNANGIENLGSYVRILGNHVHDIVTPCNSNGGSGINNANYSAHDDDIVGNFVHDITTTAGCKSHWGIGIYHSNLRGHIANNISVHNDSCGIQLWHAANAVVVANNTVVGSGVNGIVIGAGDAPGGVTNDYSNVLNNISVDSGHYGIQEFGKTGPHNRYSNNLVNNNPSGNMSLLTGKASATIAADPELINRRGTLSTDYQPGPKSPAIHAGLWEDAPILDFKGGARPTGKAFDVGAFEREASPGKWPW